MHLIYFKTFIVIAETKSLVRASEQLHVSQSTVTARLQKLESDIGQPLFLRRKSGVILTAAGTKFKRYAEAMNDLWRQARQETSLPDTINRVCNFGCHVDLWPHLGRPLMSRLKNEHPDIALSICPLQNDQIDPWLTTGLIDGAITYRPSTHKDQTIHALSTEALKVYGSHPQSPLRFNPDYIYVDAGEDFGRQHTTAYSDADIARVSFGCAAWALDYLLDQGGTAYLPESMAAPYVAQKRLFWLEDGPVFKRKIHLVTHNLVDMDWQIVIRLIKEIVDDV